MWDLDCILREREKGFCFKDYAEDFSRITVNWSKTHISNLVQLEKIRNSKVSNLINYFLIYNFRYLTRPQLLSCSIDNKHRAKKTTLSLTWSKLHIHLRGLIPLAPPPLGPIHFGSWAQFLYLAKFDKLYFYVSTFLVSVNFNLKIQKC